jgi:hypothetical protein
VLASHVSCIYVPITAFFADRVVSFGYVCVPQFGRTIALPNPDGDDSVAAESDDDDEHAFDGDDISLSQWQLVVSGCLTSILSSVAAFCSSSHLEVQERVRLSLSSSSIATT